MNYHRGSFLDEEFDRKMEEWGIDKFDIIISNPPYQTSEKERKINGGVNKKLWMLFLSKYNFIIKDNGFIGVVMPSTWAAGSKNPHNSENIFKDIIKSKNVLYVSMDCKKHFNVGIDISYIIFKNSNRKNNKLIVDNVIIDNINEWDMMPKSCDIYTMNIFKKIHSFSEKFNFSMVRKDLKKDLSDNQNDKYLHKTYTGRDGFKYSPVKTKYDNIPKVLTHRMGSLKIVSDDNGEITPSYSQVYLLKDNEYGANIKTLFETKTYKFLFQNLKYTQYNESRALNQLPKVDLSKSWTDEELYKYFNLTDEEIKLIEDTQKRKANSFNI